MASSPQADDARVLQDQPPIDVLLRGDRASEHETLDRKTLLAALLAFKKGDFSVRLPIDLEGMDGKIADAFNEVIGPQRADERRAGAAEPRRG